MSTGRVKAWTATAVLAAGALAASPVQGQTAPPTNLMASDHPWDDGTRVDLTWSLSPDDAVLTSYIVRRKAAAEAAFTIVDIVPRGTSRFTVAALVCTSRHCKVSPV